MQHSSERGDTLHPLSYQTSSASICNYLNSSTSSVIHETSFKIKPSTDKFLQKRALKGKCDELNPPLLYYCCIRSGDEKLVADSEMLAYTLSITLSVNSCIINSQQVEAKLGFIITSNYTQLHLLQLLGCVMRYTCKMWRRPSTAKY